MYYYGIHSTNNINDHYLGSGAKLNEDKKRFGKEAFIKEIIKYFNTREEASLYESQIVTEELVHDPLCYNIKCGGDFGLTTGTFLVIDKAGILHRCDESEPKFLSGEWIPFTKNRIACIERSTGNKVMISCEEYKNNKDKYSSYCENSVVVKDSQGNILRVLKTDIKYLNGELVPIWKGRKHSKETILKMKNHTRQKGKLNSQYGTKWIHKDDISKKIKLNELDQYLSNGWNIGRVMSKKVHKN